MLVTALSVDAFVASFAYGAGGIRIPARSVAVINVVCSGFLVLALLLGALLRPFLPPSLTGAVCFALLFLLGVTKLFDSSIKAGIRRHRGLRREINFRVSALRCILSIYADTEEADRDASRGLSPAEAASLAVALSLDSLAVGFGAGLAETGVALAAVLSLLLGTAAVLLGCRLGNRVASRLRFDLSWLGGALLLVLAFLKL